MVSAQVRLALQAMRYYRLWIYASNVVLMGSVVIFVSAAAALLSDPRRTLLSASSVNLLQPSFVYAYLALVVQGGILPIVGCIGAIRLSERLLNAYWMLLLVLLGGDLLMGIVWMFRFQKLIAGLVPDLRNRLSVDYGHDPEYSQAWDMFQKSARCCGVESPADYNNSDWFRSLGHNIPAWQTADSLYYNKVLVPDTCCKAAAISSDIFTDVNQVPPGRKEVYGTVKHRQQLREFNDYYQDRILREHSISISSTNAAKAESPPPRRAPATSSSSSTAASAAAAAATAAAVVSADRNPNLRSGQVPKNGPKFDSLPIEIDGSPCWSIWPPVNSDINENGCSEFVLSWLHRTAHNLFVLGYCVLAFVKLCFLAILRYELKEMVQKIKILQGENPSQMHEMTGILAMGSQPVTSPAPAPKPAPAAATAAPYTLTSTTSTAITANHLTSGGESQQQQQQHTQLAANGEVPFNNSSSHKNSKSIVNESCHESRSLLNQEHHKKKTFHSSQLDLISLPSTPIYVKRPARASDAAAADSDSGSHCALLAAGHGRTLSKERVNDPSERDRLIKDWDPISWDRHDNNGWPGRNGNNNEYHELREIRQTQI